MYDRLYEISIGYVVDCMKLIWVLWLYKISIGCVIDCMKLVSIGCVIDCMKLVWWDYWLDRCGETPIV